MSSVLCFGALIQMDVCVFASVCVIESECVCVCVCMCEGESVCVRGRVALRAMRE